MASTGEHVKQSLAVMVAASAAAFAFIFGNEADELTVLDLGILLTALAAILGMQAAFLIGVGRLFRIVGPHAGEAFAVKLPASAFAGANAYFTAFITYEASFPVKVALSTGIGAGCFAALLVRRWQGFALFMLSAYFLLSLGLYTTPAWQ
jgi:hypothetical protein